MAEGRQKYRHKERKKDRMKLREKERKKEIEREESTKEEEPERDIRNSYTQLQRPINILINMRTQSLQKYLLKREEA